MEEVDNVIRILRSTRRAIDEGNFNEIKNLSDQTIHTATISQDADNIIVAVLVYSLSKILEREHYKELEGWDNFYNKLLKNIDISIVALEQNQIEKARLHLGKIREDINLVSPDLQRYIKDTFRKAEINKAFKLYEHGLSSEKTARLLGVSLWDLSSYIGQSSISEANVSETLPIKTRIKYAEEIFA